MDIEIKKLNKLEKSSNKLYNKSENVIFSIAQKLPEKFIPHFLLSQLDKYIEKRISELERQIIHNQWRSIELQSAVDNIHSGQQSIEKAPSED